VGKENSTKENPSQSSKGDFVKSARSKNALRMFRNSRKGTLGKGKDTKKEEKARAENAFPAYKREKKTLPSFSARLKSAFSALPGGGKRVFIPEGKRKKSKGKRTKDNPLPAPPRL